jgi:CBS domain-containing protein
MMARTDVHFDAMLRHLGAAYYESLHGRASRTDVARALDTVEEHLNEHSPHSGPARTSARPHPTIPAAARLMNTHHIRRLPVVDEHGKLVGIVSRRDLLSVFLRPDADIMHDVRQVLDEIPIADPKDVIVTVRYGVITLTGTMRPEPGDSHDLIPLALRLIWDIDGVVDVVNRLGETTAAKEAATA